MESNKCKAKGNTVINTFFMNESDIVIKDGKVRVKRKYGKFKREAYKIETNGK